MTKTPSQRLRSLDAFRGATIAGMILVNTPGSWSYLYPPLAHAEWEGCTPTDLVFPFFLFIVGVSMWFSFKRLDHELSVSAVQKIGKRAALIFFIGMLLNAFPFYNMDFATFRILGVLQRIAIAFGIGAVVCLALKTPLRLIGFSVLTLLAYWGLLYGFGGEDPYSLEHNLVRQIDLKILGPNHLWQGRGIPFDPEGLLSAMPAVVTVVLGFLIGRLIDLTEKDKILPYLWAAGFIGIGIGLAWGQFFPINKALWSSSYVLYTAGLAILTLSLFLWLIDLRGIQSWAFPFIVFGTNSLFAYALSQIWSTMMWTISWTNAAGDKVSFYSWLYESVMVPFAGNLNGSLLFALLQVLLVWLVVRVLYARKIFIKV